MTIDTSGKWWVGTDASDISEYLIAYEAEGYAVDVTRICKCNCGSESFEYEADQDEGVARRTCSKCQESQWICDSEDYWDEAEPEKWICTECGSGVCNLGVGFSLYPESSGEQQDVRWVSIGERCTNCGVLGSVVDWKVGYSDSAHLIDKV